MPGSRALKEVMRKSSPGKSSDPLTSDKPAAKGKATRQYNQTGPKYSGPNYRQNPSDGPTTGGKMKLII